MGCFRRRRQVEPEGYRDAAQAFPGPGQTPAARRKRQTLKAKPEPYLYSASEEAYSWGNKFQAHSRIGEQLIAKETAMLLQLSAVPTEPQQPEPPKRGLFGCRRRARPEEDANLQDPAQLAEGPDRSPSPPPVRPRRARPPLPPALP